jgi:hypothetical protein
MCEIQGDTSLNNQYTVKKPKKKKIKQAVSGSGEGKWIEWRRVNMGNVLCMGMKIE